MQNNTARRRWCGCRCGGAAPNRAFTKYGRSGRDRMCRRTRSKATVAPLPAPRSSRILRDLVQMNGGNSDNRRTFPLGFDAELPIIGWNINIAKVAVNWLDDGDLASAGSFASRFCKLCDPLLVRAVGHACGRLTSDESLRDDPVLPRATGAAAAGGDGRQSVWPAPAAPSITETASFTCSLG